MRSTPSASAGSALTRKHVLRAPGQPPVAGAAGWVGESPPDALLLPLHVAQDIPQFWSALQAVLKETVSYDALIVYLNFLDFATSWKAAKILATPNAQRPIDWFESRREVDMTPQFVLSQPQQVKLYRLSDVIPNSSVGAGANVTTMGRFKVYHLR